MFAKGMYYLRRIRTSSVGNTNLPSYFSPRTGLLFLLFTTLIASLALVVPPRVGVHAATDISAQYNWKQLKIGGGGFVTGLVAHAESQGLVYARTDTGGIVKWNEQSQSWAQILRASNMPLPKHGETNVESIALSNTNDQLVYAAVGDDINNRTGRIVKSTDQGQNWTDSGYRWHIAGNGDYRTGAERLAVDPNNEQVVYFGSRKDGLWVTTNGAQRWSQVSPLKMPIGTNPQGSAAGIKFVVFDPNSGTIGGKTARIFVGVAGYGVYQSNDAGATWTNILSTTQIPYDAQVASDGTFYVSLIQQGGTGSLQHYMPDSGTWQVISPLNNQSWWLFAVDPTDPQRIFAGPGALGDGYFFRSTDGGANWTALNLTLSSPDIPWILHTDEKSFMTMGRLVFDPFTEGQLWFAQGTGVWRTNELNGSTVNWTFLNKGLEQMVADDVIAPPGGHPLTAVMDRIGFSHVNPDTYPSRPILSDKFASGTSLDYSGRHPNEIVAIASDHRGMTPDQSGYSSDGGQTWTQFSGSRNYPDLFGGNIAVSATDPNNIVWLPTNNKKPYVTTDRGATWNQLASFNDVQGLHNMIWWPFKKALDADKVNGGVFYVYSTDNGGKFFRSTNNGQDWEQAPGTAPSSAGNDAHVFGQVRAVPGHAGHAWVSTAQGGLYYTENQGDSWTKANEVQDARAFGFGKEMPGASYPTVYIYGKVNDVQGIWRSSDKGASWKLASQYPGDHFDTPRTVNGDMDIAGRVYVGVSGSGFIYGDDQNAEPITLNATADRDYDSGTAKHFNVTSGKTVATKFNLSSIQGTITSATLRIYRTNLNQGDLTITASKITDDSWSESGSSFLPAYGNTLTSVPSNQAGYVNLDVTAFVKEKQASGVVSIGVTSNKSGWQSFSARENGSNVPHLLVTYGS